MTWLAAALGEIAGLFVADWVQAGVTVVLLTGVYLLSRASAGLLAGVCLAAALALQLIWFTSADARRRRSPR
jgi:hypothetical protein